MAGGGYAGGVSRETFFLSTFNQRSMKTVAKKPVMRPIRSKARVNVHNLREQGGGVEDARRATASDMDKAKKQSMKRMDATLKGNKPTQKSKH